MTERHIMEDLTKELLTMAADHRLPLQGVRNARELGGYQAMDGRFVRDHVILRTGKLNKSTDWDRARLEDAYRLQTIIDLRTDREITGEEDPVIPGASYIHLPLILDEDPHFADAVAASTIHLLPGDQVAALIHLVETGTVNDRLYIDMLNNEYDKQVYRKVFEELMELEDGRAILYHCTAGKDRTGVTSMIILSALGVDPETAIKDFLVANLAMADSINWIIGEVSRRTTEPYILEAAAGVMGVSRRYIENAFGYVRENYGSMFGYLNSPDGVGLSDDFIREFRDRFLLEPDEYFALKEEG